MTLEFRSAVELLKHYDTITSKFFPKKTTGYAPPIPPIIVAPEPPPPPPEPEPEPVVEISGSVRDLPPIPTPEEQEQRILTLLNALRALSPRPTIRVIQRHICEAYYVKPRDLVGPRRLPRLILARHAGFFLCRALTRHSLTLIGKAFGGRDHTTVHHAVIKYTHLLDLPIGTTVMPHHAPLPNPEPVKPKQSDRNFTIGPGLHGQIIEMYLRYPNKAELSRQFKLSRRTIGRIVKAAENGQAVQLSA